MFKKVFTFFDRLEDGVRIKLSHYPVLYALVGAIGIILVWKGVWEMAEYFPSLFGPASMLLGLAILLLTGLLVSFFIGDNIIISGFKKEKKLVEKSEKEIMRAEQATTELLVTELRHMHHDLEEIKQNTGGEKQA